MALHFDREEFAARRQRALEAMAAQGLDALLLFSRREAFPGHSLRCLETPNVWKQLG
jgi:hypothetical protein